MGQLNARNSLIASAAAAIGASLCCVAPLVLLTVGIGGTWIATLTALEPYRPIFIGLALLFLGLAFRRLYLAPQVCVPGTPCADPRTGDAPASNLLDGRVAAARPLGCAVARAAVLLKGDILCADCCFPLRSLCSRSRRWQASCKPLPSTWKTWPVRFALSRSGTLEKVPGVADAKVDFDRKTATVTFDTGKADATALIKATTEAGYPSSMKQ
jgi:mercuric ion transport protein